MEPINTSKRVHSAIVIALSLLAIFLLAKTLTEFKKYPNAGSEYGQNIISVSGKGDVYATADVATFSFSVMEEAPTVADAQKKATEKNNNAIKTLKDNGVEEKDIQTTGYNVNPKYDYNSGRPCTAYGCPPSTPKLIGYEINQSVTVKVRDIAKAGDILTKIGATGVSNISGLSFTIDDEESLKAEARSKAIENAKEKAKKLEEEKRLQEEKDKQTRLKKAPDAEKYKKYVDELFHVQAPVVEDSEIAQKIRNVVRYLLTVNEEAKNI